jgi:urate oxidase
MATSTIKIDSALWTRVKQCAQKAGYSSEQEFVEHVLEKELAKVEEEASNAEIVNKLKGLGYLD